MYTHMQQLRQQLHIDIHRQHRRLQQLLKEQADMQQQHQQGQSAELDAEICPVRRQMEAILGGVDDTVSAGPLVLSTVLEIADLPVVGLVCLCLCGYSPGALHKLTATIACHAPNEAAGVTDVCKHLRPDISVRLGLCACCCRCATWGSSLPQSRPLT